MKTKIALLVACAGLSAVAFGANTVSSSDKQFARTAATGGAAEVEMGKMASDKGSDKKVKDFGQRMVTDHSKAGDELKALAGKKSLALPEGPDPKSKAMAAKMSRMSGSDFDRAYMKDMVADHEKDIAEFEKEANGGSDPDLKQWATDTLPTLREHLKMAKDAFAAVSR